MRAQFGAVGAYLYDLVGLRQAPGSVGWANAWLWPTVTDQPALPYASGTKATIAGVFASSWQNNSVGGACVASAGENTNASLSCPGSGNVITAITFASFGTSTGTCGSFVVDPTCNASNTTSIVQSLCVGKEACTIPVSDDLYGDPCYGTVKWLNVQATCAATPFLYSVSVPVNARATVVFPLGAASASAVTITEGAGGAIVFTKGAYVPGVAGVMGAGVIPNATAIGVAVGSGQYDFVME